jgi:hypothetical protein
MFGRYETFQLVDGFCLKNVPFHIFNMRRYICRSYGVFPYHAIFIAQLALPQMKAGK